MIDELLEIKEKIYKEIGKVIIGQRDVIEGILIALFSKGHVLLEGVPGTAKTLLAKAISKCLNLEFKRVQFTPDLMPADIIGTNIFDLKSSSFRLTKGPIFTDILLGDEINRAPPKTQSALLEAMQERQVSIDGVSYPLGEFFMVIATQNPIEYEGTYPLPEAQLDRFMLKLKVNYPELEEEKEILKRTELVLESGKIEDIEIILDKDDIKKIRESLKESVIIKDEIIDYVLKIIRTARQWPSLLYGPGPRAGVHLIIASKWKAIFEGRDYVIPDDVKAMASSVLAHRVIPISEIIGEEKNIYKIIDDIINHIPVPR